MGRPSLLDDLISKRVVDAIRAGGTRADAAQAAGIHRDSVYNWMQRGARGEAVYADFFRKIKVAEAECRLECIAVIRGAALSGTWQAAAWYLERKSWKVWGRKDTYKPVEMPEQIKGMTQEQVRAKYLEKMGAVLENDPTLGEALVELAKKKAANE